MQVKEWMKICAVDFFIICLGSGCSKATKSIFVLLVVTLPTPHAINTARWEISNGVKGRAIRVYCVIDTFAVVDVANHVWDVRTLMSFPELP